MTQKLLSLVGAMRTLLPGWEESLLSLVGAMRTPGCHHRPRQDQDVAIPGRGDEDSRSSRRGVIWMTLLSLAGAIRTRWCGPSRTGTRCCYPSKGDKDPTSAQS